MNTTAPAPTAADIKALAVEVQDLHAKYTAVLSRVEGLANGLQCLIESLRSDMEIRAAERAEDDAAVVIAALERRRNVDRVVVVDDGTMYAPARRVCGIMFDAGGYSLGCTLAEGHEHPEKHDATPGPCAKVSGTVTIVDSRGAVVDPDDVTPHGAEGETHGAPPPDGVGTTFIVDSRALGLTGDPSADGPKLQGLADHVQRATAAVPVTQRVLWMTGDADHKEPEGYRFYGPELRGRAIAAVWNVEEYVSYLVRKLGHCVLHVRYEMRDLSVPVDDYFLAAAADSGAEDAIHAGPDGLKVSA